MKEYTFIDLFCGAGGFSKGMELAGFKCVGGIELDDVIAETHRTNHKFSTTISGDIRKMSPNEFAKLIGYSKVDVIIGGPPCPTFSTIGDAKIKSVTGKPTREDPRNELFLEYLKYVDFFRPEIFIIENVPNFVTKYKGEIFNRVIEMIEEIGKDEYGDSLYIVEKPVRILNSVHYGVPQTRKRMFLVAHKKHAFSFNYPSETHYYDQDDSRLLKKLKKAVTVEDAISDLPAITDNWRVSVCKYSNNNKLTEFQKEMRKNNKRNEVSNNICRKSNDRAKKVFNHMKQGDKYMDLPKRVRNILPFREDIFPDRLKRIVANQPCWTVIAHIGMDGYMYIHPTECRTLSVREAARIQSFPDDFVFIGNQQQTYVQVGNAVPPLLAKSIGIEVKKYLNKVKEEE